MNQERISLIIGALLHDIGKVVYRAGESSDNHSKCGHDYLYEKIGIKDKNILDCVRFHHAKEIRGVKNLENNAYIVYMADNIASSVDRRETDGEGKGFVKNLPLSSIFNLLNENNGKGEYNPYLNNIEEKINFPTENAPRFEAEAYKKILANIYDNLKGLEWTKSYIHSLLDTLEANLSFAPSSTNTSEVADISLFNHLKLTAAFAAAIDDYLEEAGENDYAKRLFTDGKNFREEKAFLLTTLDFSGIQQFIYTIHSEGALKALRARSFYLDFLTEHLAGRLLTELNLTRANLIFAGGGRADLLLANTETAKNTLRNFKQEVNSWFEREFDIALYMGLGYAEVSENDLKDEPKGSYGARFKERADSIEANKTGRYSAEEIIRLNKKIPANSERECKVCKRLDKLDDENLCGMCAALKRLGALIMREDFRFFAALPSDAPCVDKKDLPLPLGYVLKIGNEKDTREWQQYENAEIYAKNRFFTGKDIKTRFWIGDYHTGEDFETLASNSTGIKRLGVLRADVDNLGFAFAYGFRRNGGDNRYVTISRAAELSRELSMFFKLHIKKILKNPKFTITGKTKDQRHAAIVYSGGDDLFIVGAWDDVIELAVDIRENFKEFSENTLTISAGIGIFEDSYPISVMAEDTAVLEEYSKNYFNKNAVSIPGEGIFYKAKDDNGEERELYDGTYSWEDFKNIVIGEKLQTLIDFFGIENQSEVQSEENERGKNFLYNILELLRRRSEKINIARYIYLLSRMEPKNDAGEESKLKYRKFADNMYRWMLNDKDTRELKSAILLYVYLIRKRG